MKKINLYKREGKKIIITDVFAMVDEDDFDVINSNRWYIMRLYHCNTEIKYARRYEGSPRKGNHKAILMHREIMNVNGREIKIDHKDGNGLNNTKDNMRISSHSENMSNRKVAYNKEIKYLGVYYSKNDKKYRAVLKKDGKLYCKYGFSNEKEAAIGYNELVIKINPTFGRLNIV